MISTAADCAAELARAQARTPLQWRKNAQPPQHEPPADLVAELGGDIIAGPAATAQRFALAAEAAGATYAEPLVIGLRSWQASLAIDDDVDILDTHTGAFLAPGRVVYPLATAGSSLPDTIRIGVRVLGPLQPACDGVVLHASDVDRLLFIKMGTAMLQPPGIARPDAPTSHIRL